MPVHGIWLFSENSYIWVLGFFLKTDIKMCYSVFEMLKFGWE